MKNSRFWEVLLKVIVAAATAFLTALGTKGASAEAPFICCIGLYICYTMFF